MAVYTLPDLPYDYAALEPAIIGQIIELHVGLSVKRAFMSMHGQACPRRESFPTSWYASPWSLSGKCSGGHDNL